VTGAGLLFMFVAFWLVSSRLVVPIAVRRRPALRADRGRRRAAAPAQLAAQSARTVRTAAALMIGLALGHPRRHPRCRHARHG
jgi:hypothetical protein